LKTGRRGKEVGGQRAGIKKVRRLEGERVRNGKGRRSGDKEGDPGEIRFAFVECATLITS
jgi:hypothetical protein